MSHGEKVSAYRLELHRLLSALAAELVAEHGIDEFQRRTRLDKRVLPRLLDPGKARQWSHAQGMAIAAGFGWGPAELMARAAAAGAVSISTPGLTAHHLPSLPGWVLKLTHRVDLSDPEIFADFESWKLEDGSEDGLRVLVERSEAP